MKIFYSVLCIFMAMLMLSGCSQSISLNVFESEGNDVKTDKIFLISFAEGVSPDTFENFRDATELGLDLSSKTIQLTDAEAVKKHPVDAKKTYNYSYSEGIPRDSSTIEKETFYRLYDFYVLDNERIAFLHDSNTVCFYTKPYNPNEEYPIMSEERVKEIADEFLLAAISEPLFSKFKYEGMSTDILGRYALLYKRYVCGYQTDETPSIWVDRSGEISGYNGYNVSKYNALIADISETAIKLSADALLSELKSLELTDFKPEQPELTTNSDGVVYIMIKFSYKSNGFTIGQEAYLKIN